MQVLTPVIHGIINNKSLIKYLGANPIILKITILPFK